MTSPAVATTPAVQTPVAGKRPRSEPDENILQNDTRSGGGGNRANGTNNGGSRQQTAASSNGRGIASGTSDDRSSEDFVINRYKRLYRGRVGEVAPAWDSAAGVRSIAASGQALTPAETSLFRSLTARGGARGGGRGGDVAGVAGLERLMRVMINAPDTEARALCLELLIHSKGDSEVMSGFIEKRGLTFIKGWLEEEAHSVGMIKLILAVAKILPVSYSSLKQSDVVAALKALRKHSDPTIRKQSKAVISHWRTALVGDQGEIGKQREKLDELHDTLKAKQEADKTAKTEAEKAEKAKRDAIRAQNRPPVNGTNSPLSPPAPPLLYTRASSANSMDSEAGVTPSKAGSKPGMSDKHPPPRTTGTSATPVTTPTGASGGAITDGNTNRPKGNSTAGDKSAAGGSAASTGPGRFFVGRTFPGRGRRGRMATTTATGAEGRDATAGPSGTGKKPQGAGRGGAAGAGKPDAVGTPRAPAGAAPAASSNPAGGILKNSGGAGAGSESVMASGGNGGSIESGTDGGGAVVASSASSVGAGTAGSMAIEGTEGSQSPPMPESPPSADDAAASGPPPIVSLDELTRADELAKKAQRKAKRLEPARKSVSWADRSGLVLQAVKEFHSDEFAQTVSDTTSQTGSDEQSAEVLAMGHNHPDHARWAERVKREREMERKFHGKGKGSSGSGGGRSPSSSAAPGAKAAKAEAEAEAAAAAAAARRKAMTPTVRWRRPGPYADGVVHEDVLNLEVDSSEAESQGARTRAGLEQVYLSSGDIPPTPAEPDAASFIPSDNTKMYKIPFFMESELEQAMEEQQRQQQQQQQQQQAPPPPPPKVGVTLEQARALEAALATVDQHAANALRGRFSQEPRLLTALITPDGQVHVALLRSLAQQALSTPLNVHLTIPHIPLPVARATVPAAMQPGQQYAQPQQQLPPPPPPRPAAAPVIPGQEYAAQYAVAPQAPAPAVSQALPQPQQHPQTIQPQQQTQPPHIVYSATQPPPVILVNGQQQPQQQVPPPPPATYLTAAGQPIPTTQTTAVPAPQVSQQPLTPQPAYYPPQQPQPQAQATPGMALPPPPPPPPPPMMYLPGSSAVPATTAAPVATNTDRAAERGKYRGRDSDGREGSRGGRGAGRGRGRGRGRGGEERVKYDDKGRVKSDFCRYYNSKLQVCTNDPCRFIHDINHVPGEPARTRSGPRPSTYTSSRDRDRDTRDRDRDRDRDRGRGRDRAGSDGGSGRSDRDDRRDRRDGDDERGIDRGSGADGGGRSDSRERSDRGGEDKRPRYR